MAVKIQPLWRHPVYCNHPDKGRLQDDCSRHRPYIVAGYIVGLQLLINRPVCLKFNMGNVINYVFLIGPIGLSSSDYHSSDIISKYKQRFTSRRHWADVAQSKCYTNVLCSHLSARGIKMSQLQ